MNNEFNFFQWRSLHLMAPLVTSFAVNIMNTYGMLQLCLDWMLGAKKVMIYAHHFMKMHSLSTMQEVYVCVGMTCPTNF